MPLDVTHTGPVALSQEQSDIIAVVSLLRTLGARPIPAGARERSWEAVKDSLATRECASKTTGRLSSFTTGRA